MNIYSRVQYYDRNYPHEHELEQQLQLQQQVDDDHHHHHHLQYNSSQQLTAQYKRKEKARLAARARRSQEALVIMELANELHITQGKLRFDKATIVRLAIEYIKAFDKLCRFCHKIDYLATFKISNYLLKSNTTISKTTSTTAPSIPQVSTMTIFSKKDLNDYNSNNFLILTQDRNGKSSFIYKPEHETKDDDLTHLAPQAGEVIISLDIEEPLESIELDQSIFVN